MALTQTQVSELYVAIFNRASEGEGNAFWQTFSATDDVSEVANIMLGTTAAQDYFGSALDSDQDFVEWIYQNTFNKTIADDPDGIAFWVQELADNGGDRGAVVEAIIFAAKQPENAGPAQDQFLNRVAVSNYAAQNLVEPPADLGSLRFDDELTVTDDDATVTAAQDSIDDLADEEPVDPGVPGDEFLLTSGTDRFTGTANNDFFDAPIMQNPFAGGVSNSLSTADRLDGGAGTDTLYAELVPEFVGTDTSTLSDVQPRTTSIEIAEFEALDFSGEGENTVTVDASKMLGVQKIGSAYSDGDLIIENLTTLANDGSTIRNTSEMTITMDHTDNFNSDGDASDLTVYFDEDYLVTGQQTSGAQLVVRLINAVENEAGRNSVEKFNNIVFAVGETNVTVDISAIAADEALDYTTVYQAIVDAINAQLDADGFSDVSAALAPVENAVFSIPVAGFQTGDPAGPYFPIVISNDGPEPLTGVSIDTAEDASDTDLNNSFSRVDPTTEITPISVDVELHKVGQDGDGGNLVIGGKDITGPDDDVDQNDGIEVFNIEVLGNEDRPSNLGYITSTNGALRTVNIDSETRTDDSYAALTVRGGEFEDEFENSLPFGGTLTNLNANTFFGDLYIGTDVAALNIDTFSATGGGDVFYNAVKTDDGVFTSTMTGAGSDTIIYNVDGDSVDTIGEGFMVSTGAGDDEILVQLSSDVSQSTMYLLDNLDITSGSGDDYILVDGIGNFDIVAGTGSDFVEIDSFSSSGESGDWGFGDSTGPQTWGDAFGLQGGGRVLYQAQLTVMFAGFESTVTVETTAANNYVATQIDINNAIADAIDSNPELARLLEATLGTGLQTINVAAQVEGLNDFAISLYQPTLVDAGEGTGDNGTAGPGQLTVTNTTVLNDLAEGLIQTQQEPNSSLMGDADGIRTQFNEDAGSLLQDGSVGTGGTAGLGTITYDGGEVGRGLYEYEAPNAGGSSNGTELNYSEIDMGTGANDLLSLSSANLSANTIQITDIFGKVSVVNFFDDDTFAYEQNGTDAVGTELADVGIHRLDFTAFLTNTMDESDNSPNDLSEVRIATTLETDLTDLGANEVAVVDFNTVDGWNGTTTTLSFATLTASQLLAEMNAAGGAGSEGSKTDQVQDTNQTIVLVENNRNAGEYKVFSVQSDVDNAGTDGFTSATLLGTLDFGYSISRGVEATVVDADGIITTNGDTLSDINLTGSVDSDNHFNNVFGLIAP